MSTEDREDAARSLADSVVEHEARKVEMLESIRAGVGMVWAGIAAAIPWVGDFAWGWIILNISLRTGLCLGGLAVIYRGPLCRWWVGRSADGGWNILIKIGWVA